MPQRDTWKLKVGRTDALRQFLNLTYLLTFTLVSLGPQAPYLPDNLEFVAKNNAFTGEQLKHNLLSGTLMTVVVGFFCGNTVSLPVDPRQRMSTPKTNPSRVFTPEGTFGWGGSCASIYPVDSPGGYQV